MNKEVRTTLQSGVKAIAEVAVSNVITATCDNAKHTVPVNEEQVYSGQCIFGRPNPAMVEYFKREMVNATPLMVDEE